MDGTAIPESNQAMFHWTPVLSDMKFQNLPSPLGLAPARRVIIGHRDPQSGFSRWERPSHGTHRATDFW